MRFLLDTNTCIDLMRGNTRVADHLRRLAPADCTTSTVTSFELFTGVVKCSDPGRERGKVALLLRTIGELPFDEAAARAAADLRGILETGGAKNRAVRSPDRRSRALAELGPGDFKRSRVFACAGASR